MFQHLPPSFWDDDDKFAAEQARWFRNTDVDFMKLSMDKYFGWGAPILQGITEAKDLYKIEPLSPNHPYIRGQIERTKKVVDAINGECVTFYTVFAPLSNIRLAIDYPMMMKLIREDPEAMKHACGVVAEDEKAIVSSVIKDTGEDGLFCSVQNGEVDRFTTEEYTNWVMPYDRIVLDYANSLSDMNCIHFCAWEERPNNLEVWKDYKTGLTSWSKVFDIPDIQEAKKHFGCTIWGGFDNRPGSFLYTAFHEEIEAEIYRLIEEGGRTGYILSADCGLRNDLSGERIRWGVAAAHNI